MGGELLLIGPEVLYIPANLDPAYPVVIDSGMFPKPPLGAAVSPGGLSRPVPRPQFLDSISTLWSFPSGSRGFQIVWGIPRKKRNDSEASSVWYARFDGKRWSEPELVMKARVIDWWHSQSAVVNTPNGIVVAAPATDSAWRGVIVSRQTKQGWHVDRFGVRAPFEPPGVALASDTRRVLLFYKEDITEGDSSAIYMRELNKVGNWSEERLIHPLPRGAANWPIAVYSGDGRFHLFWVFSTETNPEASVLEHLSSVDLHTWTLSQLSPHSIGMGINAIADGGASVQVVMQADGGPALVRVTADLFSSMEQPFTAEAIGTGPNLIELRDGSLVMTWTAASTVMYRGEQIPAPLSLLSRRSRCK